MTIGTQLAIAIGDDMQFTVNQRVSFIGDDDVVGTVIMADPTVIEIEWDDDHSRTAVAAPKFRFLEVR